MILAFINPCDSKPQNTNQIHCDSDMIDREITLNRPKLHKHAHTSLKLTDSTPVKSGRFVALPSCRLCRPCWPIKCDPLPLSLVSPFLNPNLSTLTLRFDLRWSPFESPYPLLALSPFSTPIVYFNFSSINPLVKTLIRSFSVLNLRHFLVTNASLRVIQFFLQPVLFPTPTWHFNGQRLVKVSWGQHC